MEDTENPKEDAEDSKSKKNGKNQEMDTDGSVNAADEFDFDKYDEECKFYKNIYEIDFYKPLNQFNDLMKYYSAAEDVYCNIDGIAEMIDGKDPLITVEESDDEDSEKEDDVIKPNDNLVLVGHIIDEASILEVYGKLEHFFDDS